MVPVETPPEDVRWELLAANYDTLAPVVVSFPFLGGLVAYVWGDLLGLWPTAWAGLLVFCAIGNLALGRAFRRAERSSYSKWARLRLMGAALNGVAFGLASLFLMPTGHQEQQVVLFMIVQAGAAASVTTSSHYYPALVTYLTLSLMPLTYHIFGNDVDLSEITRLVPIFWAVMMSVGYRSYQMQLRSAMLSYHNRALLNDLKKAQANLEQANAGLNLEVNERTRALSRFRALLDASGDGILVATADDLHLLDWNRAAATLLGFEEPTCLRRLQRLQDVSWPESPRDGLIFHQEAHLDQPLDIVGTFQLFDGNLYLVMVLRDSSERLELEQQLLVSQRVEIVGQMAGGLAHDFNNMLTVILGLADYLRQSFAAGDPRLDDAEAILATGERARELTGKLLRLSKSKLERPEPLDLSDRIRELSPMLRRSLGAGIELVILLEEGHWVSRLVRGDLDQLLLNLAVNASDAMPQGGTFTIRLRRSHSERELPPELADGEFVCLEATDTGIGMTPEVARRVFEPYFTTKGAKGHGLGLAVSHSIVRRAGGSASVKSQPGQGTTFRFWLPLLSDVVEEPKLVASPPKGTSEVRILLVEDQDQLRNLIERQLRHLGHQVVAARSSEEAMTRLDEHEYDLLLSDIVLPGVSGVELARRVANRVPAILMMSGFADEPPLIDGRALPLLRKPFTFQQLSGALADLLVDQAGRASNEDSRVGGAEM